MKRYLEQKGHEPPQQQQQQQQQPEVVNVDSDYSSFRSEGSSATSSEVGSSVSQTSSGNVQMNQQSKSNYISIFAPNFALFSLFQETFSIDTIPQLPQQVSVCQRVQALHRVLREESPKRSQVSKIRIYKKSEFNFEFFRSDLQVQRLNSRKVR